MIAHSADHLVYGWGAVGMVAYIVALMVSVTLLGAFALGYLDKQIVWVRRHLPQIALASVWISALALSLTALIRSW